MLMRERWKGVVFSVVVAVVGLVAPSTVQYLYGTQYGATQQSFSRAVESVQSPQSG